MRESEVSSDVRGCVTRARLGDVSAWETLIPAYQPQIETAVKKMTRNKADIEELVQETFTRAIEYLGKRKRDPSDFGQWLLTHTSQIYNALKRKNRQELEHCRKVLRKKESSKSEVVANAVRVAKNPALERRQLVRELSEYMLEGMSELHREIAVGYFLENMSYKQLSASTGLPAKRIKEEFLPQCEVTMRLNQCMTGEERKSLARQIMMEERLKKASARVARDFAYQC